MKQSEKKSFNKRKVGIYTLITFFISAVLFFIVPLILNKAFEIPASFDALVARWGAGDALSFYGAVLTFIGTVVLGYVAYWQSHSAYELNKRLEVLEKTSLVVNNAAVISIDGIEFDYRDARYFDFNQMPAQILEASKGSEAFLPSYCVVVTLQVKVLSGFVSLVEIKEANIMFSDTINEIGQYTISVPLWFKNIRSGYSTVAIKDSDKIAFTLTLITKDKEVYDNIKAIQQNGRYGILEIQLNVVTFTSVMSQYKCRVYLSPENGEEDIGKLTLSTKNPPLTFWRESALLQKKDIKILEIEE